MPWRAWEIFLADIGSHKNNLIGGVRNEAIIFMQSEQEKEFDG